MHRGQFVLSTVGHGALIIAAVTCSLEDSDSMGTCRDANFNNECDFREGSGGSIGGSGGATSSSVGGGGSGGATGGSAGMGGEPVGGGGSGGTALVGGGGAGGILTGGSGTGGSVSTGGGGGSPPTIGLEWEMSAHPPNVHLGIAGIVDFPAPTPDIDPPGRDVLLPSCLAAQSTDSVVACDVGVAESGTILHIELNSYTAGGTFQFYHCDDPAVVGEANAICEGTFTVTIGGSLFAVCSGVDPLASPCVSGVNPETGRRWYEITIP